MRNQIARTLLLLTLLTTTTMAADLVVNPDGQGGTHATIGAAMAAASHGDRILLGAGVFTGAGNRDIMVTRSVEIRPVGDAHTAIIDCGGSAAEPHRAFTAEYNTVVFDGLVIRDGYADHGGAMRFEEGHTTLANCVFEDNTATAGGGAVQVFEEGELVIDGCTFAGNHADTEGGAVQAEGWSMVTVDHSTFVLNSSAAGAHLFFRSECEATIERSILAWAPEGDAVSDDYSPNWSVECSAVHGNRGGNTVAGTDNMYVDPELCDPAGGVHNPTAGSPIVNTLSCGTPGAWPHRALWAVPVYGVRPDGRGMYQKIQDAMDGIPEGAVIALADGYFTGYRNDDLNPHGKTMTLRSRSGDPLACIIDPQGSFDEPARCLILNHEDSQSIVIEDLGFDGGWTPGDGALIYMDGPVDAVFRGCDFDAGTAYYGTSVYAEASYPTTTTRFENCSFRGSLEAVTLDFHIENCSFTGTEGGVRVRMSYGGTVQGCLFHDLTTEGLGAAIAISNIQPGTLVIHDNTFENCRAIRANYDYEGSGGAIKLHSCDEVMISDCQFTNCRADNKGGDIYAVGAMHWPLSLSMEGCQFTSQDHAIDAGGSLYLAEAIAGVRDCTWEDYGGASEGGTIYARDSDLQLSNCQIEDSQGSTGGAIWHHSGDIQLTGCLLKENRADMGGALYTDHSEIIIEDCNFSYNRAELDGGAVAIDNQDFSSHPGAGITNSVFWQNTAARNGAACGALSSGVHLTVTGSTLHWNEPASSAGEGGQIYLDSNCSLTLEQAMITGSEYTTALAVDDGTFDPQDVTASCTNIWGNSEGDWTGLLEDLLGQDGNISLDPRYCEPTYLDLTVQDTSPCLPENNSCGLLIGAQGQGCASQTPVETPALRSVALHGAHPNPFNPSTTIRYTLPADGHVTLTIHDVSGRLVRTLRHGVMEAGGPQSTIWNGLDDRGCAVASGVYVVRLVAGGVNQTQRVALIK